jgi:hypothetical protein
MAITFTAPPASIADLAPTLQAGGALAPNTTYYYVVVPLVGEYYGGLGPLVTGNAWTRIVYYGGISNEINVTTDAVNKQVRLDWTAAPGAEGYCVFRAAASDSYDGLKRLPRAGDGSVLFCTTLVNSTTDAGAYALTDSLLISVVPAGSPMPDGMDPRTDGLGMLVFDGGTAINPLTFALLYADAVANGWTNWCAWDGTAFTLMAQFLPTNNETHFLGLDATCTLFGWFYCESSHASSNIQFGELAAAGNTVGGVRFVFLGGGEAYTRNFAPGVNSVFYDSQAVGQIDATDSYYVDKIIFNSRWIIYGGKYRDFKITNFFVGYTEADVPLIGVTMEGFFFPQAGDTMLAERCQASGWFSVQYAPVSRMDRLTDLDAAFQIRAWAALDSWHIDGLYPNTLDTTNFLPYVLWGAVPGLTDYVYILQSFRLRVVDGDGASLVGASVSIEDATTAAADDFDGTAVTAFTTDAEGDLWREKITISARTANTITDGTKVWGADEWKGRNIVINSGDGQGQQRKVETNTGTVLTFTEAFQVLPAVNDTAGIALELYRARMNHKAATGIGAGPAFTDTLLLTPHIVTISLAGYITRTVVYEMDRPREEIEELLPKGLKKTIEGELLMEINAAGDLLRIA